MKTLRLGRTTIDRVVEIERLGVKPKWLFPNVDIATVEKHKKFLGPRFVDLATNELYLSFHSFLIRREGLTILVDTCNGNHKSRPTIPFLDQFNRPDYLANLSRLGVRPEDIDLVFCTHLHTDHVGWNTQLENGEWVPTFPNARYLMSRREFAHFQSLSDVEGGGPVNHGAFADSVLPVVAAGLVDFVDFDGTSEHPVSEEVALFSAHGHSMGHMAMRVVSDDASAIVCGDAIHHPIQFLEPHLVNMGDAYPEQARETRDRLLRECCDEGSYLLPGHFPSPTAAKVVSGNDGFRCVFETFDSDG